MGQENIALALGTIATIPRPPGDREKLVAFEAAVVGQAG
jgi:hypothetical protein